MITIPQEKNTVEPNNILIVYAARKDGFGGISMSHVGDVSLFQKINTGS